MSDQFKFGDKIIGPCDCDSPWSGPGGRPSDNLKADTARPDSLEHRDGLVVAQPVQGLAVHWQNLVTCNSGEWGQVYLDGILQFNEINYFHGKTRDRPLFLSNLPKNWDDTTQC